MRRLPRLSAGPLPEAHFSTSPTHVQVRVLTKPALNSTFPCISHQLALHVHVHVHVHGDVVRVVPHDLVCIDDASVASSLGKTRKRPLVGTFIGPGGVRRPMPMHAARRVLLYAVSMGGPGPQAILGRTTQQENSRKTLFFEISQVVSQTYAETWLRTR